MRSSLRYVLIVVALLAGTLFVACGGDSDDNGEPDSDEPTAEQPADGDDGDDGDDDGDVSGDLRAFADRFGISEVTIEYKLTASGGDDDFDGTMTLYLKPPDAWRMDLATPDGDIALINDGSTTYLCASEGGEGQCFESPIDDALPIPFLNIFTDPGGFDDLIGTSLGAVDVSQSTREIAGQDATCFEVSGEFDGDSGEAEYCFRDDGVLLLLRGSGSGDEGGGEFSLEATSVSDSVSDEDFQPIYDVLDLGDLIP